MIDVPVLHEQKRGCGFRKAGGLYLVSGGTMEECELLPIELDVCPTCGEGIKPARGWTWIDGDKIIDARGDTNVEMGLRVHGSPEHGPFCPLSRPVGRCGLIWIGEAFYPTVGSFMGEARSMGVSRRITAVPRDFEVGKTLVLLAHRKATTEPCECVRQEEEAFGAHMAEPDCEECEGTGRAPVPAIFTAFVPRAIEYVVKGDESDKELERLVERGIRPVKVEPAEETMAV